VGIATGLKGECELVLGLDGGRRELYSVAECGESQRVLSIGAKGAAQLKRVIEIVNVIVRICLRLGSGTRKQSQSNTIHAVALEDCEPILRLPGILIHYTSVLEEFEMREIRPGQKVSGDQLRSGSQENKNQEATTDAHR
jgi:hypothetical protein